ncbi:Wzz/FepE/Etk N-terminal domain-containing protein [Candidatus Thioglobus sp.]|nr:Wzz/FepE/Etk N-terminal domain-containing protein [Candidatus Thioglobus sp.]
MKNSDLNNEYLDDEIDLVELLRTLYSSKKLIIIVTLAFSLLAFIYTTQKEVEYQSTVILEVGSYNLINGEKKLVEPISSLIKKLKVDLVYKQQLELDSNKLNFKSIEDQLMEINYTSPSPELNETILNEAITFSQKSYEGFLAKMLNSLSDQVKTKELQIDFLKNSSLSNKESKKLEVKNEINGVDTEVVLNNIKIKFLSKLLITQQNDLILEDQLMTLQAKVKELETKKKSLEEKIKLIDSSDFVLKEVFEFKVEKNSIEKQIKLIKNSSINTQLIREIKTSEIKLKQLLTILIGTILGFIFSVFIVFIRQAFLKEQN